VKAILIFLSPARVHVATLTPAGDVHIHGKQKRSLALAPPSHRLQVERGLLKVLIVAELWDTISWLLLYFKLKVDLPKRNAIQQLRNCAGS
jgi:hypothetical protein